MMTVPRGRRVVHPHIARNRSIHKVMRECVTYMRDTVRLSVAVPTLVGSVMKRVSRIRSRLSPHGMTISYIAIHTIHMERRSIK